jgi:hypothetical protein
VRIFVFLAFKLGYLDSKAFQGVATRQENQLKIPKVDCSGDRLMVCWKI